MAVGLTAQLTTMHPVAGLRLGVTAAGIKKPGRRDLVVIEIAEGAHTAAVFTRNAFCAAPVIIAREHLKASAPRYLLINSGNANAGNGEQGLLDAGACCHALAVLAGCEMEQVLPFSTGVIGEPLPVEVITRGLPNALANCREDGWQQAAQGIMTTDTVPKGVSQQIEIGGRRITISGIAKGSGMIHPDMATMLAYVATDARVGKALLQQCLEQAMAGSFNCVSVDGDTSTNDACLLIATGKSELGEINDPASEEYRLFAAAVANVCAQLAQMIVRDGEGATKFITIDVVDGASVDECRQVAFTVAHSPLVKTAFFASDPNWGRILAAVGRAGLTALDVDAVTIHLDDVCIVEHGRRASQYQEQQGQQVMQRDEITIRIALGRGACQARIWTCDFSYDYVRINAEYRT